jgi:hypothetical protein
MESVAFSETLVTTYQYHHSENYSVEHMQICEEMYNGFSLRGLIPRVTSLVCGGADQKTAYVQCQAKARTQDVYGAMC